MSSSILRQCDILIAMLGLVVLSPILMIVFFMILILDRSFPFFIQDRLGRDKVIFKLIKFRTMHKKTQSVPTHQVSPESISQFGRVLRSTKLDELPQLFNVLKGDMSLVGPRPGLAAQVDLTAAREALEVFSVTPGITGLSQVNEIDMSTPELLAKTDAEMIHTMSITNYFKYIFLTLAGKGSGDRVR